MTTGQNTICYPEDENESNCPILDIKFSKTDSEEFQGYEKFRLSDKIQLVFTKTLVDSTPITSARFGTDQQSEGFEDRLSKFVNKQIANVFNGRTFKP